MSLWSKASASHGETVRTNFVKANVSTSCTAYGVRNLNIMCLKYCHKLSAVYFKWLKWCSLITGSYHFWQDRTKCSLLENGSSALSIIFRGQDFCKAWPFILPEAHCISAAKTSTVVLFWFGQGHDTWNTTVAATMVRPRISCSGLIYRWILNRK